MQDWASFWVKPHSERSQHLRVSARGLQTDFKCWLFQYLYSSDVVLSVPYNTMSPCGREPCLTSSLIPLLSVAVWFIVREWMSNCYFWSFLVCPWAKTVFRFVAASSEQSEVGLERKTWIHQLTSFKGFFLPMLTIFSGALHCGGRKQCFVYSIDFLSAKIAKNCGWVRDRGGNKRLLK